MLVSFRSIAGSDRGRRRLVLPLALWLVLQLPAAAADITVGGNCTLVDAITAANTDTAIQDGCPAGSGADRIFLTGDVTLSTINNGSNGLPVVTTPITIEGGGFEISRPEGAAPPAFRFFDVESGGALTLKSTTLNNGGGPNFNYDFGGAIYVGTGSSVELVDSTVILSDAYYGGAIATADGTVTLTRSTLAFNGAFAGGGAIDSELGNISLVNSTVSGNTDAYPYSGAIDAFGGSLTITNSTLSGNTGAIYGAATVTGSIIANSDGSNCPPGTFITDGGGNVADDTSCGSIPSGLTFFDPVLRDNGGPTMTHLITATTDALSSAVNRAGACGLATDQRGVARPAGECDSGSFEAASSSGPVVIGDETINGPENYEAEEIQLGPNLTVIGPSGHLTVTGTTQVFFVDSVAVLTDGRLTAGNGPAP
jgi:hypothetical protein